MSLLHCETMRYISLFMRFDDVPMASIVLAESGFFDPSRASYADEKLPDRQGIAYRRIFNNTLSEWEKISQYLAITPEEKVSKLITINKQRLVNVENRLNEIGNICSEHKDNKRKLDEQLNSVMHLFSLLDHFSHLDIDLSMLQQDFKFLDVRLGIIPLSYLSRLKQALGIEGYYLSAYVQEKDSAHVIIAGVKKNNDIQALLDSASFQSLHVPSEFHQHPKRVYSNLADKQQIILEKISIHEFEWSLLQQRFKQEIIELGDLLALAKPYAILSETMLRKGQLIEINGWVPLSKMQLIKQTLDKHIANPVIIQSREPTQEEYAKTPSYLLRPQWLQPFLNLVTNYGAPGYREFDPSWFFTLSYVLMFGLMFGDVGHGACILGLSLLIKKKWPEYSPFFMAIGLSSMLFGLLYGSIFSYEHILPSLWLSPMEEPMLMLKLALLLGACFLVLLNVISIYNHWRNSQLKEALFNSRGMVGLLLYIAIFWGVFELSRGQFSILNAWSVVIPLMVLFIFQWLKCSGPVAERFLVSLFETYDVIIAYFSNTISFLRVAAFALNHSALAIALFALATTTNDAGHWMVIILGNLFILLLEGAIVAIQVLRLEYYEGFSRFFTADGYLFKPMELSPQKLKITESS